MGGSGVVGSAVLIGRGVIGNAVLAVVIIATVRVLVVVVAADTERGCVHRKPPSR